MKSFGFIILILCFFTGGPQVHAQRGISPSKQCKLLNKKRRYGAYSQGRKRPKIARTKSFGKAERTSGVASTKSESVDNVRTASATRPESKNTQEYLLATDTNTAVVIAAAPSSKKKRRKPAEEPEATLVNKNTIIYSGQSNNAEKEAIQSEVTQQLAALKEGESIHLPTLYLNDNNGQLEIVNMKPFLEAVEYGKRGRTLIVNGIVGTPKQTEERLKRFKDMLVNMGVSPELISTSALPVMANAAPRNKIDFTVL